MEKTTKVKERINYEPPKVCPWCGNTTFVKWGKPRCIGGRRQRYQCANDNCGRPIMGEWVETQEEPQKAAG